MTAQAHEELILNGEHTSMAFCPPIPEDHPAIEILPEDEVREDDSFVFSTGCWRGYIGTWEITDGKFYLRALKGRVRLTSGEPLFADWFTGMLRIPRGEILQYVHMGFGSLYEREVHIQIHCGEVVGQREVDNRSRSVDEHRLGLENLPGFENNFPGDDEPVAPGEANEG